MPTIRLYDRDITFHIWGSPFVSSVTGFYGHTAWTKMNPMCWGRPHIDDFSDLATVFHAKGMTGTLGESSVGAWSVTGSTAQVWGKRIAYQADIHSKYYRSRGLTYSNWAFVPQDIGETPQNSNEENSIVNTIKIYGNTADNLVLSSLIGWTGSTGSLTSLGISEPGLTGSTLIQDYIKMSGFYIVAGLTACKNFVNEGCTDMKSQITARGLTHPGHVASDTETYGYSGWPFFSPSGNSDPAELGGFIQSLNDPRASTYRFFDRYTLLELWGSTGNTATALNTTFQQTVPYNFSGPTAGSGTLVAGPTYASVIISQRVNSINYNPGFYNFQESLRKRHVGWMLSKAYADYKTQFPGLKISNYEISMCCKDYPLRESKPAHAFYLCDLGATGSLTGMSAGATGLFELDVASPVCFVPNPNGVQNVIPGFGYSQLYYGLNGSSPVSFSQFGTGIWAEGGITGSYNNFLQLAGIHGLEGISGDGYYEGFDGANLIDLQRFILEQSVGEIETAYRTKQKYASLSNVAIIPWTGNVSQSFSAFMGDYSKSYGSTTADSVPFHFNLFKRAINDYGVTEFFLFDQYTKGEVGVNATTGIASLDYWNNIFTELAADSDTTTPRPFIPVSWTYPPSFRTWEGAFTEGTSYRRGNCVYANGHSYVWQTAPGTSTEIPSIDDVNWLQITPSSMAGLLREGEWTSQTTYTLWQVVSHNGAYYIMNTSEDYGNVAPPTNPNWDLMEPAESATGDILNWRGTWVVATEYILGDTVYDSVAKRSYYCTASSISSFNRPEIDPTNWSIARPYITSGVLWVGDFIPDMQYVNYDVCRYNGSYYFMDANEDYGFIPPGEENPSWILFIDASVLTEEDQNPGRPGPSNFIAIGGKIYNRSEYERILQLYYGR